MDIISRETGIVKENVIDRVISRTEQLLEEDPKDEAATEVIVWRYVLDIAVLMMTVLLARRCFRITTAELADFGLSPNKVNFRLERDYFAILKTTFGTIVVPWFTYRRKIGPNGGAEATRTASRSVLPLHPRCHSSTMLLRWEALLGTHAVFGTAESLLTTLTHGEVTLEDTTIASHCEVIGSLVDRTLMYKSPEMIRDELSEHAVLDKKTGKPLLNVSCDA
jgi:hypothetical protein